jgi:glucokinase
MMEENRDSVLTLGVDIGGTKIDTALVDADGNIISSYYRLVDPEKDPDKAMADIVDSINICLDKAGRTASALGVGVAGQIDKETGIVRRSPNLPDWKDVPLAGKLTEILNLPVCVNNDVRVITWGEWKHGAGQGAEDLVCLFVGTGVGGGIVTHGHLLEGCQNTAGELGHLTVVGRRAEMPLSERGLPGGICRWLGDCRTGSGCRPG